MSTVASPSPFATATSRASLNTSTSASAAPGQQERVSSTAVAPTGKAKGKTGSSLLFSLFCFVALSVQNASIVLLTRWLKINRPELVGPSEDTLIVVGAELLKCASSLLMVFYGVLFWADADVDAAAVQKKTDAGGVEEGEVKTLTAADGRKIRWQRLVVKEMLNGKELLHMGVPACIYLLQNKLIFLSYGKLPSPIFQVTYQTKILTAALMARFLMKKVLTQRKWIALVLLMTGITIVQVDGHAFIQSLSAEDRSAVDFGVGILAAFGAVCCSGLGGVYFEMVLKSSQVNLWVRNVHLSLVSVLVGIVSTLAQQYYEGVSSATGSGPSREPAGGFDGQLSPAVLVAEITAFFDRLMNANPLVWGVILLHCYGGLLVSLLIKYTDNIVKAFAAAISILVASLASLVMFPDFQLSRGFMLGFSLVAYSVYMYSN
eukprot:g368.t1